MKGISKRFAALMTALLLLVSAGAALAEAPKMDMPTPYKVMEAGGAIGFEGTLRLNADSLKGLLMMAVGASDEAASTMVDAAFGAVNKLSFSSLSSKDTVSGVLGTAMGELITFQVAMDEASMENIITTNLLPGIALKMDPKMFNAAAGMQTKMSPEELERMVVPYGEALLSFFSSKLAPKPEAAEELYDIAGVGQFHYKAEYQLTTKDLAELVEKLFEIFKKDQKLQSFFQNAAASSGKAEMKKAFDLEEAEKNIAELKKTEEKPVINGTVYTSKDNDSMYFVMDSPESQEEKIRVTVLAGSNMGSGADVKVKVLVKTPEYAASTQSASPAPAIDWMALEEEILAGKNMSDTLVAVDVNVKPGETEMLSTFKVQLMASEFNATLDGEGSSRMDRLESRSELRLGMNGAQMITLTGKMFETDQKPAAPQAEGLKVVTLKADDEGEMSVSDEAAVKKSLEEALPVLMENLKKALPEEGPALVSFITQSLVPQQPPMVEEETEEMDESKDMAEPAETAKP